VQRRQRFGDGRDRQCDDRLRAVTALGYREAPEWSALRSS